MFANIHKYRHTDGHTERSTDVKQYRPKTIALVLFTPPHHSVRGISGGVDTYQNNLLQLDTVIPISYQ